jgi:uncharacterized protein YecE (DUF72 family)
MRILTGTSGWSYAAWKGRFYPEDLPSTRFLAHYARRLDAVEVNATFYRAPRPETLAAWRGEAPAGFVFALKAPQRITHRKRLVDVGGDVAWFLRAAAELGSALGPVLFQLPPTLRQDLPRLRELLAALPRGGRFALEVRHESWLADETFTALSDAGVALCVADTEETSTPLIATAPFGYLRLRRPDYDGAALARWAERIQGQRWTDAFVFFKHEDEARGPEYALRMREIVRGEAAEAPAHAGA